MNLTIGYLYGDYMNIYGDTGNIITLQKRAQWRGVKVLIKNIGLGTKIEPGEIDLYFFGGGQDYGQELVSQDLKNKIQLKKDIEKGVPLLSICGGYQLLGDYYQPAQGPKLEGLSIFPAYTKASDQRMIGNIVIDSQFGKLVGFENHSGKTYLKKDAQPLGKVIKGFGNNGEDQTEGCIYKNAVGCYMHGSLLPKNPELADWLLKTALEVKYGKVIELEALDDNLENQAHQQVISRFS